MIHAGTIRTGSGLTSAVVGAYWINSIRRLRYTTLPRVTATLRPASNASHACSLFAAHLAFQVLDAVLRAAHEVQALFLHSPLEDDRIGE